MAFDPHGFQPRIVAADSGGREVGREGEREGVDTDGWREGQRPLGKMGSTGRYGDGGRLWRMSRAGPTLSIQDGDEARDRFREGEQVVGECAVRGELCCDCGFERVVVREDACVA